jgi:hypothetical protein
VPTVVQSGQQQVAGQALTCGADPLHFAAVFGIDDTTAIRYATVARQFPGIPPGCTTPPVPRTQGPERAIDHNGTRVRPKDPTVRLNSGILLSWSRLRSRRPSRFGSRE